MGAANWKAGVPGSFAGLPVAPARLSWRLTWIGHGVVIRETTAVDFRTTVPPDRDFWSVYARGTYQNAPRFGIQQFGSMPGKYLFNLARLDTKRLPNGVYVVTVEAVDERGNLGSLAQRISILNVATASGCVPPPAPPPPPTTTTTTTP